MPGGVLSVDWPFEEPVAVHEELYISHTLQRSADRSLSPKKIKIVPHETQRMFHAGMVALKIFDYKLGDVVVCCYDDWVTSTDRKLCVLKPPIQLQ
jgi:hypothetical protein